MKKILILLVLSTSVVAASDLFSEFSKRKSLSSIAYRQDIFDLIKSKNMNPANIIELELVNEFGKFAVKFKNDDVCFGEVSSSTFECYDAVGYKRSFTVSDND